MKEACCAVGIWLGNGAKHLGIDADSQVGPANSCRTHAQSSHVVTSRWHARVTCEGRDGQWEILGLQHSDTSAQEHVCSLPRYAGVFYLVYGMRNFSQQLHRLPALCLLNPYCCCLLEGKM